MVVFLVESGCNILVTDDHGYFCSHVAVQYDRLDILVYLASLDQSLLYASDSGGRALLDWIGIRRASSQLLKVTYSLIVTSGPIDPFLGEKNFIHRLMEAKASDSLEFLLSRPELSMWFKKYAQERDDKNLISYFKKADAKSKALSVISSKSFCFALMMSIPILLYVSSFHELHIALAIILGISSLAICVLSKFLPGSSIA